MKTSIIANKCMEYTGERMVPEAADLVTYWEHVVRYAFACKRAKRLSVLDIASGEGYGTYALSKVASNIIGVDISSDAVNHAREKYALDFRLGSAQNIPVESNSMDCVVSFETIEHVPDPGRFVEEAFRVLKPDGIFIVSTPNKEIYLKNAEPNPFHCSELTKTDFIKILNPHFKLNTLLGQSFASYPVDDLQRIANSISNRLGYYFRRYIEERRNAGFWSDNSVLDIAKRKQIAEAMDAFTSPFSEWWNPFCLRRPGNNPDNQPKYFVAVARRRNTPKGTLQM